MYYLYHFINLPLCQPTLLLDNIINFPSAIVCFLRRLCFISICLNFALFVNLNPTIAVFCRLLLLLFYLFSHGFFCLRNLFSFFLINLDQMKKKYFFNFHLSSFEKTNNMVLTKIRLLSKKIKMLSGPLIKKKQSFENIFNFYYVNHILKILQVLLNQNKVTLELI